MKYKKTATFFAVLAAFSAIGLAIYQGIALLDYGDYIDYAGLNWVFAVSEVAFGAVCFSKKKAKLIPFFLLPPAVLALAINVVTGVGNGFVVGLLDATAYPVFLVSVPLFIMTQIAFRSTNPKARRTASVCAVFAFLFGQVLIILSAIGWELYQYDSLIGIENLMEDIRRALFYGNIYILYTLFTALWLNFQVKATNQAAMRPTPVIPTWQPPAVQPAQSVRAVNAAPQPVNLIGAPVRQAPVTAYVPQRAPAAPYPAQTAYVPSEPSYPPEETYIPYTEPYAPSEETYVPQEEAYYPQEEAYYPQEEVYYPQEEPVYPQEETNDPQEEPVAPPEEQPPVTRQPAPVRQPSPSDPPLVVTNEMIGQLKMLNNLVTDGVISQEEFEARRNAIFRQQ
ncbi:MAG: hypothetical protein IK104_05550 [Clostridia bacterium]|nr:hypothetical protein [Clostridia bacterium]